MLDQAQLRCPEAQFTLGDMCEFQFEQPFDLITCFLYSIHYRPRPSTAVDWLLKAPQRQEVNLLSLVA